MFTFTEALIIAAEAHRGVKDGGGVDYIKHPLHLAHMLKVKGYSNEHQMVAVLHDVVEDTDVTFEDLISKGVPETVLIALRLMTHISDEVFIQGRMMAHAVLGCDASLSRIKAKEDEYMEYINRLSKNDIARIVKIEDLDHNSDINRTPDKALDEPYTSRRYIKYAKARRFLTGGRVGW